MNDLIEFLNARLDEDEAQANTATYAGSAEWSFDGTSSVGPQVRTGPDSDDVWIRDIETAIWTCDDPQDGCSELAAEWTAEGEHVARHDPARVLREVEAKRRIIDGYERALDNSRAHPKDLASSGALLAQHGVVKLLTLPYADHRDYRPEWRPDTPDVNVT